MPKPEQIGRKSMDSCSQANMIARLQELTRSPGFIYAFARAAADDQFIKLEEPQANDEWLTERELTLTAGLLANSPISISCIPSEETLEVQLQQLHSLHNDLHDAVMRPMQERTMSRIKAAYSGDDTRIPFNASEMVEPIFYSGSGAYVFQYLEFARDKYRYDSSWLLNNVGLSIDAMVKAAERLVILRQMRFKDFWEATTHVAKCQLALEVFSFARDDLDHLSEQEFEAFTKTFAVTPGQMENSLTNVGDRNELEFKPIIELEKGRFFLPIVFDLAKSIYESPFYWMMEDRSYKEQAARHRGRVTEEIAARLLKAVFQDRVYRNVEIRRGKDVINEIDVLAIEGNRALVVQAKSKRLTLLSRQGDDAQMKKDFVQAVQEAYEQGLNSRRLLLNSQHDYMDKENHTVYLPHQLQDVYVICLTLDHFPAISPMTRLFLEKEATDPSPVAMSIFDLDVLVSYLATPLDFIHYTYQRSKWSGRIYGSCEVSFLAWYLNRGLSLPQEVTGVVLTESMAGQIDADYPQRKGKHEFLSQLLGINFSITGDVSLNSRFQNSELRQFISLLEKSPDPEATDASFLLLDLSQDIASYFQERIIEAMYECNQTNNIYGCCIVLDDGTGISFVWVPHSAFSLESVVHHHAVAYKYKHKSNRWLGLGSTLDSRDIAVTFSREAWRTDADLDELARTLLLPDGCEWKPSRNALS